MDRPHDQDGGVEIKKEEVIEITDEIYGGYPPWGPAALARLNTLCNEVERRTLERAAVVCEEYTFTEVAATAIRALKESK